MDEAIICAKQMYITNIYAVVTDNAPPMMSIGKNIELLYVTCNSHSGNLLAKAMVESSFTEKITKVLKELKSSALERKIVNFNGRRISLPGDTR